MRSGFPVFPGGVIGVEWNFPLARGHAHVVSNGGYAASLPHRGHQELQKEAPLWSLMCSAYNSAGAAVY